MKQFGTLLVILQSVGTNDGVHIVQRKKLRIS